MVMASANLVFATRPAKGGAQFAAALHEYAGRVRHFNKPRAAYLCITDGTGDDNKRQFAAAAEILGQG